MTGGILIDQSTSKEHRKRKRREEKGRESEAIDTGNETNLSETQPTCVCLSSFCMVEGRSDGFWSANSRVSFFFLLEEGQKIAGMAERRRRSEGGVDTYNYIQPYIYNT